MSKVVIIVQDCTIQNVIADDSEVEVLILDRDDKGEDSQEFTDDDDGTIREQSRRMLQEAEARTKAVA